MNRVPVALLLLPVLSTLAGGWLALRARRYQLVLAFAGAGLLLGTALFDLFPEALQLAVTAQESTRFVVLVAAAAFSAFWVLDAALDRLPGRRAGQPGVRRAMGRVSGGLLILHSFRDGMVIGAAFAASHAAGMIVALGIVVHDIGDGMNTVLLSTAGERATRLDYGLLLADALAPLAGGLLTIWWVQSPANAVVLLAVAAGFFVQMATSDLRPRLHVVLRQPWVLLPAFVAGFALIGVANFMLGWLSR